ncbi:MAG: DNA translocase FtsK 4TM domain-containing protein [Cyclobacteriaceae bacterium]
MAQNTYKAKPKKKSKSSKKVWKPDFSFINDRRFQLAAGFFLLCIGLSLFFSIFSYLFTGKADQSVVEAIRETGIKPSGLEAQNWLGLFGAYISYYFVFKWFGIASILIPPYLILAGLKILSQKEFLPLSRVFYFSIFFLFWISLLMGYFLINSDEVSEWGFLSGGIGFELAILFESLVGWGTFILLVFSLVVFLIYFFNITSLLGLSTFVGNIMPKAGDHKGETNVDPAEEEEDEDLSDITSILATVKKEVEEEDAKKELGIDPEDEGKEEDEIGNWDLSDAKPVKDNKKTGIPDLELELNLDDNDIVLPASSQAEAESPALEVTKPVTDGQDFVDTLENYDPTLDLPRYQYPQIDLLTEYPDKGIKVTKEELEANKDKIVETLINFKIGISSIKATIGPTVTLYEIIPEAGVKISKIKNLEDDIALSLAALGIRIIAPIPGKGTIGIEVPNKNREMVDIKSVLSTEKFMKSDKELPIVFGKTISNEIFVTDLAKMPHLLMAGATGQGKSVGLNVILTSLVYKKHPSQLKFVLVDPKKVELTLFNKIERHFLAKLPDTEEAIITDTTKVIHTLNSLCIEMDSRYDLLKDAQCRNIKEYNKKFINRRLNPNKGHKYLPYIVLVIDELADLMMTAGKEIETPIARLAQLARAIGIHLVVATQRPSVNVITGVIKANFPTRISFRVTSKIDSRTILDSGGADQLVGMGDMLLSTGSEIIRLQCAFVDTPEVERICDFIGEQNGYDNAYQLPEFVGDDDSSSVGSVDLSDRDVLFEDAAKLIVMHQQGSTSLIQRKLKLGYNRAGRLIDQLEAAGIVGPFEGSKAREVLIPDEYSLEQLLNELS